MVVWVDSLPKSTPKAYGFDYVNKISSINTISGSGKFNKTVVSVVTLTNQKKQLPVLTQVTVTRRKRLNYQNTT